MVVVAEWVQRAVGTEDVVGILERGGPVLAAAKCSLGASDASTDGMAHACQASMPTLAVV